MDSIYVSKDKLLGKFFLTKNAIEGEREHEIS